MSNISLKICRLVFSVIDSPLPKHSVRDIVSCPLLCSGMRKFRIDQDLLIEHWQMIYIMPVVFAEIYS